MRIAITGAGGFIGRHCLPLLVGRGHEVYALSSRARQSDEVSWRQVDLLDAAAVRDAMASLRPTHLLHLAWITAPGRYWTSPDNLRWVAASLELVHAFHRHGGERVVVAGTCAEYDWAGGRCSEATTPLTPSTLYGVSKRALGSTLEAFAGQTGLSAAWGRIFFTYGFHEHPARLVPSIVGSLLSGRPAQCSAGTQARDFLFVEDVAEAFIALIESQVRGAVNIASGVPVRIQDVVLQIADLLDARDLIRVGAPSGSIEQPELLFADVDRLTREVGVRPRYTLATGLDATIQWWRTQLSAGLVTPQAFG